MQLPMVSFLPMPPNLVALLSVGALVIALAFSLFAALQFWSTRSVLSPRAFQKRGEVRRRTIDPRSVREASPPNPLSTRGEGASDASWATNQRLGGEAERPPTEDAPSSQDDPARSWVEATFLALVTAVVLTGWLATLLATFGIFSLATLAVALLVSCLAGSGWGRSATTRPRFAPPHFLSPTRHEWLLLPLLLLCALLYFRPHDYLLAGIDPGSYVNLAAAIADSGRFANQGDPAWTALVTKHAALTGHYVESHSYQFLGWYAESTPLVDGPGVVPQFFPFHPALMAVAIAVGDALNPLLSIPALGLKLGLRVTPLWGVLGVAAVFYLGRTLFSANVGLLAAGLLALSPLQIYFARYPTTEPLTLLLIFCALWGFQQLWESSVAGGSGWARSATTPATAYTANHQPDNQRKIRPLPPRGRVRVGFFTAITLGAALLTRIDLPLVVLLLVSFALLRWRQGRWSRGWTIFAATFAALATHAVGSALLINDTYVRHTYGGVLPQLGGRNAVLAAVAGVALAGLALALYPAVAARLPLHRLLDAQPLRLALAAALIALSVYAYFVRPFTSERLDAQNWVRLGWYLTPLGLLLATLGWAQTLRRASLVRIGPVVLIGLLTTVQYVFRLLNNPVQIYGMRRYVPIVLPMLMLGTAVAILAPLDLATWHAFRLRVALSVALALALAGGMTWQGRSLFAVRELRGSLEQVAAIDALLAEDAIVLLPAPGVDTGELFAPSTVPDEIGVPLAFAFGHNVATIRYTQNSDEAPALDPQALAALLADVRAYASERNLPLQLVSATPLPAALTAQLNASPVGSVIIDVSQLELTYRHFPRTVEHRQYPIDVYRVE